jgi:2-polyprenyl-3-methyl-5-hydroxy-6-metoxy-1,4-benzoquinol methylase
MENGSDISVINQFDKIASLPDKWDHNRQYQNYLIKNIPKNCSRILDVGCGTGELTRKLVLFGREITGIDISENMLHEAEKRNYDEKIKYMKTTAEDYLEGTDRQFDIIISIAALHHMNEERILKIMKNKLTENGKILVLDIVKEKTIFDYFLSIIAVILNPIIMLVMNGRLRVSKNEREAWTEHFQYDKYLTITEVKNIAKNVLGKAKIKRHLFWRYSLIYSNKSAINA